MKNGNKKMDNWKCDLVQDFIDENKEIAFLYIMRDGNNTCEDMIAFIEEMKLESKFYIYCDIKSQMK